MSSPSILETIVAKRREDVAEAKAALPIGELQRAAFPDLTTLRSSVGVSDAVDRSVEVLESMGLEIVQVDRDNGIVEATDTTFWFGFKDDLVVRLRPSDAATLVDVHSVSRVGGGDLGANAQRIQTFFEQLEPR